MPNLLDRLSVTAGKFDGFAGETPSRPLWPTPGRDDLSQI
jgi:hypothetical protein